MKAFSGQLHSQVHQREGKEGKEGKGEEGEEKEEGRSGKGKKRCLRHTPVPFLLSLQICQQLAATSVHILKNQLKSSSPCLHSLVTTCTPARRPDMHVCQLLFTQYSQCLALWSLVSVYELPGSPRLLQLTVHNMALTLAMQVWERAVRPSTETKVPTSNHLYLLKEAQSSLLMLPSSSSSLP